MRVVSQNRFLRKYYTGLCVAAAIVWAIPSSTTCAQVIEVDVVSESLQKILNTFTAAQRVDLVYVERQVEGRLVTCSYVGTDVERALACILNNQDLRAVRLRRRQYVLVEGSSDSISNSTEDNVRMGTLRGFVTDAISQETLPGAHVYLPELAIGAVSNEGGYYAIPALPIGQYLVSASFLGYSSLDTLITISEESVMLELERGTVESGTVIVSSNRRDPYEVAPGVREIPVNLINRFPGLPGEADLLQSLRWLPSVQRVRTNQGGLVVRGGEPDQIQYLIDGAPVYHMWHVGGLLSVYQPEVFKDVRLYRGSFPAEYGGRLSAVLDAELKDGTREGMTGLVGVGLFSARLFAEGPIGDEFSFMVSGRRSYLDRIIGRRHPVDNGVIKDTLRTGIYLYDVSTKLAWRPSPQHRLTLGVYGSADVLDIRLPINISRIGESGAILPLRDWLSPSSLVVEFDTRWSNRLVSARYHYLHADRFFLSATAYATSYRAHERIFLRPVATSSISSKYAVDILDIGIKLDMDYYLSLTHHIRAGVSIVQRNFSSELEALILQTNSISESTDEKSTLNNTELVLHIQDTWKPTRRLQVQPGLRISQLLDGNDLRLSPRLGVRYALDRVILRAAAGINVQYLHQVRDRYSVLYDLISYRWVPASGSVEPSYSYHGAVGGNLSLGMYLKAGIATYVHITRGLLIPRDEEKTKDGLRGPGISLAAILGQYTRGEALAYGLEGSLQYERGANVVWVSYAAGRSRSRAPSLGEEDLRPTRYDVPQRLEIVLQRNTRNWTYGLTGQWRSGYPVTVPEARYAIDDPLSEEPQGFLYFPKINNGRLPPYVNYGLQGAYRFDVGFASVQVRLDINNITFRRNIVRQTYTSEIPEPVSVMSTYGVSAYPLLEIVVRF